MDFCFIKAKRGRGLCGGLLGEGNLFPKTTVEIHLLVLNEQLTYSEKPIWLRVHRVNTHLQRVDVLVFMYLDPCLCQPFQISCTYIAKRRMLFQFGVAFQTVSQKFWNKKNTVLSFAGSFIV